MLPHPRPAMVPPWHHGAARTISGRKLAETLRRDDRDTLDIDRSSAQRTRSSGKGPHYISSVSMSFVPSLDDMDDDDLPPSANHVADAAYAPPLPRAGPRVPAKARFVLPRLHAATCQPGNTLYLQVLGKWSHTMVVPPGYKPTRCAHTYATLRGTHTR